MRIEIQNPEKVSQFFAAIEAEAKAFGRDLPHAVGHLRAIKRDGNGITVPDCVSTVAMSAAKAVGL